jgi:hypothetical protein
MLFVIHKPTIVPKLINAPEKSHLIFQTKTITSAHILQIINNNLPKTFEFSIQILTSYSYGPEKSKSFQVIGQYVPFNLSDQEKILSIFITPSLTGECLYMHQLNIPSVLQFYPGSVHSQKHLTEGHKITFPATHKLNDQPANNLHCICDHPTTEEYFPPRKYKNLGNFTQIHGRVW